MKSTKFAVGFVACVVMGMTGWSMAQEAPKAPAKVTQPAKPRALNPTPVEKPANNGEPKGDKSGKGKGDKPAAPAAGDPMAAMMALAPEHDFLKQYIGTWSAEVTFWEEGKETKSHGTSTYVALFEGRYVQGTYAGDMMGMPFKGAALIGYNKVSKKFESMWADSMSTAITMSSGKSDSAGKVITMSGVMDDPMTGASVTTKEVTTFDGKNTMTFEMFAVEGGKENKMIRIVYTKTAAAGAHAEHKEQGSGKGENSPGEKKQADKK